MEELESAFSSLSNFFSQLLNRLFPSLPSGPKISEIAETSSLPTSPDPVPASFELSGASQIGGQQVSQNLLHPLTLDLTSDYLEPR